MAETQTKPAEKKDEDKRTDVHQAEKKPQVKAADVEKLAEDPRFDFPTARIRTAEDAYQAYLREEIDESQLRAAVSVFGGTTFYALKARLERPDDAYVRSVPEDLFEDPSIAVTSVEDRLKVIEDRDKEQEKATKEQENDLAKTKAEREALASKS